MFKIEHILASNYYPNSQPSTPSPNPNLQHQLSSAKIKIKSLQSQLSSLIKTLSQLQSEIITLKNKNAILFGELQTKMVVTPQKSMDLMDSGFSLSNCLKTPSVSIYKQLRFETGESKNSRLKEGQKYSVFKMDNSLFDSEKFSEFPRSSTGKSQPYKRFKAVVKLFTSLLVDVTKTISMNKSYKNQQELEDVKNDINNFVKEFNMKHQTNKITGMQEKEQNIIYQKLKHISQQIKQLLTTTFGSPLTSTLTQTKILSNNTNMFVKTNEK